MEKMNKHIKSLHDLFLLKGYDSAFSTKYDYPGKVEESLTKYLAAVQRNEEPEPAFPVSLLTYSYFNGEDDDSIKCFFEVDYDESTGFSIHNMEMILQNCYGNLLAQKQIDIDTPEAILSRQEANRIIREQRTSHQLTDHKGLKR